MPCGGNVSKSCVQDFVTACHLGPTLLGGGKTLSHLEFLLCVGLLSSSVGVGMGVEGLEGETHHPRRFSVSPRRPGHTCCCDIAKLLAKGEDSLPLCADFWVHGHQVGAPCYTPSPWAFPRLSTPPFAPGAWDPFCGFPLCFCVEGPPDFSQPSTLHQASPSDSAQQRGC